MPVPHIQRVKYQQHTDAYFRWSLDDDDDDDWTGWTGFSVELQIWDFSGAGILLTVAVTPTLNDDGRPVATAAVLATDAAALGPGEYIHELCRTGTNVREVLAGGPFFVYKRFARP